MNAYRNRFEAMHPRDERNGMAFKGGGFADFEQLDRPALPVARGRRKVELAHTHEALVPPDKAQYAPFPAVESQNFAGSRHEGKRRTCNTSSTDEVLQVHRSRCFLYCRYV